MDELLKRIAEIRKSKGLTQTQVSEKIGNKGVARNSYNKIETGKTELTVNHLIKIAGALGVSVVSLIDPDAQSKDYFQELNSKIESLEKRVNEKEEVITLQSKLLNNFKSAIIQSLTIAEFKSIQLMSHKANELDNADLVTKSIKYSNAFFLMILLDNDLIDKKDIESYNEDRRDKFESFLKELAKESKSTKDPQKPK